MLLPYADFVPSLDGPFSLAPTSAVIGRTVAQAGLALRDYASLRADGEWVRIGADVFFAERATVHIAHGILATSIGSRATIGRFGLVHACTLGDDVVVGDGATVMDAAVVGPGAFIAPGALVPPRKQLAGGWVYEGNPATPTREIGAEELRAIATAIREGRRSLATAEDLPPLDMAPFVPHAPFEGALHAVNGRAPRIGRAFVASTAVVVGDVSIADDAGVYFACAVSAGDGRIAIGERSNVQDNSLLATTARRGPLTIGRNVTIGHNVQMGAGTVEDDALVGMASRVGDGVVVERGACVAAGAYVEPGTVVKAGWIWAGRPARAFRELKPSERAWFAEGVATYVDYGTTYRAGTPAAA